MSERASKSWKERVRELVEELRDALEALVAPPALLPAPVPVRRPRR